MVSESMKWELVKIIIVWNEMKIIIENEYLHKDGKGDVRMNENENKVWKCWNEYKGKRWSVLDKRVHTYETKLIILRLCMTRV